MDTNLSTYDMNKGAHTNNCNEEIEGFSMKR